MRTILAAVSCLTLLTAPARADITVGAVLSLTGPGASLGIPERNTIDLLPRTIGGQPVHYVVLDDATDSTAAVRAARKLIDEEHVDLILGPSVTPTSLAVLDVIGGAETPMISLAGSNAIIDPPEGNRRWAFKPAPTERLMTAPLTEHMAHHGVHNFGAIAFATAFGDGMVTAIDANAARAGLQDTITVRYNPTDTSVAPQVLRVLGAKPDAVFIGGSGTPGIAPIMELRARGYTGPVYTQQGIANADVLKLGGKSLEGMIFTVSPALVAEQLADSNPVKKVAVAYVTAFEARYGPGTRSLFGATAWDAYLMVEQAAPAALAAGKPGTPEFRRGLRDAMEKLHGLVGAQGVFNLSPTDHSGSDASAQVLVTVRNGAWTYLPE